MIPTQKITSAALGGAASVILFWLLRVLTDIDAPAEVGAAGATVLAFLCGFWVRETRAVPGTTTFADQDLLPVDTELLDDAGQSAGYVIVVVLAVIGVLAILWFLVGGR